MRIAALILLAGCLAACQGKSEQNVSATDVNLATDNMASEEAPRLPCEVIHERVTEEECSDLRALREDVKTGAAALDVPDPMTRGKAAEVTLVVDRRSLRQIRGAEQQDGNAVAADMNAVDMNAVDMNAVDLNVVDMNAEAVEANAVDADTSGVADDDGPATETPNQVVAKLGGKDHPFNSRVGRYMTARLVGDGFAIKLISPSDPLQEIPSEGSGTWIWEVTPTEGGPHTLTVLTEAVGKIGERTVPLGNGRSSKTISVQVRPVDRLWDVIVAAPGWLKALAAVIAAVTGLLTAWFALGKVWRNRNTTP